MHKAPPPRKAAGGALGEDDVDPHEPNTIHIVKHMFAFVKG